MLRFFFLVIFFTSLMLPAQVSQGVFSLKPSLGLNGCQVHGDNYSGYNKLGLFGGVAVNAFINERASLELGFYFSQKGSRKNPTKDNPNYYRLNMNYIDLPLSFYYMLNKRYFVSLGPSIAYLISYTENIDYVDFTGMYKFNKYEVGLNIGLGRTINRRFSVEVRCSNSISTVRSYGVVSNVFYPNPVARFFNKGFYNNLLTVMLTYKMGKTTKSDTP